MCVYMYMYIYVYVYIYVYICVYNIYIYIIPTMDPLTGKTCFVHLGYGF